MDKVKHEAYNYGLEYHTQIASKLHVFRVTSGKDVDNQAERFRAAFPSEILSVAAYEEATIRHYLFSDYAASEQLFKLPQRKKRSNNLVCSPCYEPGEEKAWELGYTGKGVTIAVVDTGVEIAHPDLSKNINIHLSHSFVDSNASEVKPQTSHNYWEYNDITAHGTMCAGVIGAEEGNDICSAGVAYNASIVALKVFKMDERYLELGLWQGQKFNYDKVHFALEHERDKIDIYSCSFNVEEPFIPNLHLNEAVLKAGVEQGRGGKGSIYVFSAGNSVDGDRIHDRNLEYFANSIYTLAITSIGEKGVRPKYIRKGACILAAALGDTKLLSGEPLQTTSHKRNCKSFSGTSAAAARASGSIALALQANPNLGWRDVAYLIVQTSSLEYTKKLKKKKRNGAGYEFHPYYGFGLINVTAMVLKAETWEPVPTLHSVAYEEQSRIIKIDQILSVFDVNECHSDSYSCVQPVEQVTAKINFSTDEASFKNTNIVLISPMKTRSKILNHDLENKVFNSTVKIEKIWTFSSVHFWGEPITGKWTVAVKHRMHGNSTWHFILHNIELTFYGACPTCKTPATTADFRTRERRIPRATSNQSAMLRAHDSLELLVTVHIMYFVLMAYHC